MPTEHLHGLYDGGHGAGLDDYWRTYESSPLLAGAFLWDFADEAVLRTDMDTAFYDSDGNHASDGILGPHREKEGSFYTVKEIWSPVQVEPLVINKQWDGKLYLQNKYIYTNLDHCSFTWKAIKTHFDKGRETIISSGEFTSIEASPGETKEIEIPQLNFANICPQIHDIYVSLFHFYIFHYNQILSDLVLGQY